MSKTKWYAKPMYLLVALALVLSLGVMAAPMAGTAEAHPGDYYVATSGNDTSGDGSEGNPWRTIQHAVDSVNATDTVNVAGGTYNETVSIPSGKDGLEIAAASTPIVDGTGLGDVNGFNIASNNVKIHGFTIQNFVSTVNMQGWGIITEAGTSGGELYDNTITLGSAGIYILASTNYEVYDNNINNITGNWPLHGHGIIVYSSGPTEGAISGNIIGKLDHPNSISDTTGTAPGSGQGIFVGSDNDLAKLVNADGTKVEYNIISNVATTKAIQVAGVTTTSTVDVTHNQISGSKLCGLHIQYCGTINVNSNTFSGPSIWPVVLATYDAAHAGNCLTGEEMYDIFKNNGNTFDKAAAAVTPAGNAINTSSVNPNSRYIQSDIQDAIDDAHSDTVEVLAGTYQEAITVDKSLTLKAASKPIIDCSNRTALGLAKTDGCIEVTADNVVIQGFKLIGYDPTGESWSDQKSSSNYATIKVTSGADGLKVKDNEFTGTSKAAVGLLIDDDCDDVEFTGNTVTDYLQGVAGHKNVDNLLVEDNEFTIPIAENTGLAHHEAYGYGVQLWHGNNLQVIKNSFTGSWNTATGDYEDPDALCNHYAVSTFTTYFASAFGWPDIVGDIYIEDNEMTNLYLGVGSFAGGGEVEDNNIHDNLLGIQLGQVSGTWATAPTAGLSITCNDIENNNRGIWAQSFVPDGVAAHFNNIVGNTEYGAINDDSDLFHAENNWWGAADGPSLSPGTGDKVSDNVTYAPWLGAELVGCECQSVTDDTLDAKEEADTEVVVDGTANVTAAEYCFNPEADLWCEFDKYIDVSIDNDANVTEIEIRLYYTDAEIEGLVESSLSLYWWDGSSWLECSNSGVNAADIGPYSGYIWAIIDATSTPGLSDLQGTPFGGCGNPPPVPRVPASPGLLISAAAFAAGVVALVALRRRRVAS